VKEIITPLGKVTLALDTVIDISRNTPLFNRAEAFSIDLSVPRLPNEKIFGYKYRLASTGSTEPIEARFLYNGREQLRGSVEVISASRDSFQLLLKGSRNDFLFRYGNEKLRDLVFGFQDFVPEISPPFQPTDAQIQEQMVATLGGGDYCCFPVYNGDTNTWINRWSFDQHTFAMDVGGPRTPFLRIHRALERLFELKGYTVTENWFSVSAERRNIVLYNNTNYGVCASFDIRTLYPDWTIGDFIGEMEDYFPVTMFIDARTKTVRILGDDDVVNSAPAGDLTSCLERDYTVVFNEKLSGFDLTYALPDSDPSCEGDYDYVDQSYSAVVYTIRDLPLHPQTGAVYKVLAEGAFYRAEVTDMVVQWIRIGNVALGLREGKGEIKRASKIYPMMTKSQVQTEEVTITQQYVGTKRVFVNFSLLVPYTQKASNLWMQDFRPMIYRGFTPAYIAPDQVEAGYSFPFNFYPLANFVNRKVDGTNFDDQSVELTWEGLKGAQTIAFLESVDKINTTFLISQVDLEKLDNSKVYIVDGRRVLLSEMVMHYCEGGHVLVEAILFAHKTG